MKLTKRAVKLLNASGYTTETNPAIAALVAFAAQNSGLDPRNYDDGISGFHAARNESRSISADMRRFSLALAEAAVEGVTDADVIAEAPHAFGGRLEMKTPLTASDERGVRIDYTTGQYFPTEYRKAAATVLEYATRRVRGNRPAKQQMPRTIGELKALNRENGGCWFEAGSMRFFGTKIESGVIAGNRFVTSEQPPHGSRRFTVRSFDSEGSVDTVGEFCGYGSRAAAMDAAHAAFAPTPAATLAA